MIQPYRKLVVCTLALLYVVLPFVEIAGESAFRFDVPTLKLHFFGTALWMQEFYYLMLASLLWAVLFLFTTLVFGRVWCGWMCPQTIICDLQGPGPQKERKSIVKRAFRHGRTLIISVCAGIATVGYFVSPYEMLPLIMTGELGPVSTWSIIVISVLTYLNLALVGRLFCRTICPYAKLQGAMTDNHSLVIAMDENRRQECIKCQQCLQVCPTGLDIRNGMQISCIMCASCVDACAKVMAKRQKKSLIHYQFGSGGRTTFVSLLRPPAVILGLLTLLGFILLVYQFSNRPTLDFNVLPHGFGARYSKNGDLINGYVLSVKNMEKDNLRLQFSIATLSDDKIFSHSIKGDLVAWAGLVSRFPLFVRTKEEVPDKYRLQVILHRKEDPSQKQSQWIYFRKP